MSDPLPSIDALRRTLTRPVLATPVLMRTVMYALLPGTVLAAALLGIGVLVNVLLATVACVLTEALMLRLRHRPVAATLCDGSAALAGWLLALTVTPSLPVWQLLLGCLVAIALAKHVFGGLGHNPFNPAMIAYAVLLVSFPVTMTDWPARAAQPLFDGPTNGAEQQPRWDALSGQTPLDAWRQTRREAATHTPLPPARTAPPGTSVTTAVASARVIDARAPTTPPGQRQALIALAWLLGGVWMLWRGVIRWHIPVAMLATLTVCELVAGVSGAITIGPLATLFAGGAMLGAFFIATDPVSAAATPQGRLIYGCGIGLVTFTIRQTGSWPDGVAFGVLLMNGAVPLIDRLGAGTQR